MSQNINTLTSSSATGNQWYYNGTLILGATSQNYTASLVGLYSVLVTNSQGCSASSVGITVNEFVDLVDLDAYVFSIFPNPSQGDFSISFTTFSGSNYTIKIYNAAGQLIYEDELANQNQSGKIIKDIHLGELASGVYNLFLAIVLPYFSSPFGIIKH
ncbi:MAG: T9SS C-terminal target domain-containing protein [Flavobacteriia bacterium]|nr:T9SS C-terminal target domain-containing protein [Flavobacteriia bacterium]